MSGQLGSPSKKLLRPGEKFGFRAVVLDLDRFKSLAEEILKLNSKLHYTYGGTIK